MGDLKPIGSEKLQGDEKLRRIMEIARYNEVERSTSNVNETVDYTRQLADGKYYSIIHEKNGYIIKTGLNESEMDYAERTENRRYHSSYSKALKKLNLMAKELNTLHENEEGLDLFGEQDKKFVLKTPKPEVEAPAPEPEMDLDLDVGSEGGEEELDLDMDLGMDDEGGEELDMDLDLDAETPAEEEEISIKEIQKLTGKLGQKLRTIDQQDGLTSEDIKYVLNSIISAVDLDKLSEEDKEDILENFEEDEIDYGVDDEADLDVDAGEELDLDMDLDMDMDMEEPMEESAEVGERVMDEIFAESKIDKVLSKYFVVSDEEKTLTESKNIKNFLVEKIQKVTVRKEMKSMCETVEQELTADFLLKENKTIKFLGKTNKGNLVFENDGQQIKVSQKGELL
ncbi:hypothetical protein N9H63_01380 [bacterium]|nr:hypothetical protein [bacterium]